MVRLPEPLRAAATAGGADGIVDRPPGGRPGRRRGATGQRGRGPADPMADELRVGGGGEVGVGAARRPRPARTGAASRGRAAVRGCRRHRRRGRRDRPPRRHRLLRRGPTPRRRGDGLRPRVQDAVPGGRLRSAACGARRVRARPSLSTAILRRPAAPARHRPPSLRGLRAIRAEATRPRSGGRPWRCCARRTGFGTRAASRCSPTPPTCARRRLAACASTSPATATCATG